MSKKTDPDYAARTPGPPAYYSAEAIIVELCAAAIYDRQRRALTDQSSVTASRLWRSGDVPDLFWNGYRSDARAVLGITGMPPLLTGQIDRAQADLLASCSAGSRGRSTDTRVHGDLWRAGMIARGADPGEWTITVLGQAVHDDINRRESAGGGE